MDNKIKCPACLGKSENFLSLDEYRLIKFKEYSNKLYNGLLYSWFDKLQPELSKCTNCGHIFYKNMPTEDQLAKMYSSAIRESKNDPARAPSKHMIETMKKMYKLTNKTSPTLLDYGAGYGRWSNAAVIAGFNVVAFEPHLSRTVKNDNYTLVTDSKELFSYKFDVIWLEQVLEHIVEPANVLRDISQYMHENTVLRVTVPNVHRAKEKDKIWNEWPYDGKNSHTMAPYQHLHGFNQKSLTKLIIRMGYDTYLSKGLLFIEPIYLIRFYFGKIIPSLSVTKLYLKLK